MAKIFRAREVRGCLLRFGKNRRRAAKDTTASAAAAAAPRCIPRCRCFSRYCSPCVPDTSFFLHILPEGARPARVPQPCLPMQGGALQAVGAHVVAHLRGRRHRGALPPWGSQDTGAGVARAWRGRGAGYRQSLAWVARAIGNRWLGWRGRGAGMARACPVTPVGRHTNFAIVELASARAQVPAHRPSPLRVALLARPAELRGVVALPPLPPRRGRNGAAHVRPVSVPLNPTARPASGPRPLPFSPTRASTVHFEVRGTRLCTFSPTGTCRRQMASRTSMVPRWIPLGRSACGGTPTPKQHWLEMPLSLGRGILGIDTELRKGIFS
eukprot:gene17066-biopygen23315